MRNQYLLLLSLVFVVVACQKEVNDFDATPPPGDCLLTRIVQGTGIDDSVFIIKYDAQKRIAVLIDSSYSDTLTPTYSGNNKYPDFYGFLSGGGFGFKYNPVGKVIEVEGLGNKTTMQYAAGDQLSVAASFYLNINTWEPTWNYTFAHDAAGNLTKFEEFNPSNASQGVWQITYTDIPNPFGDLAYYNYGNFLGMDDIFPAYMFIHQSKLLPKTIQNGGLSYEISYGLNTQGKVVTSIARLRNMTNNNIEFTATRHYYYSCP
ncbi:hypothetical protein [Paraflavitalea pollutisoli]|uniref:hypothetical protein n=1 Tax=Paraflavitalea pollutisoli TaxID=3034143 RepID=UPI0023EC09B1|nr:hypothetical protein [Paraflavitalea sp. H1-2-19X]